MITVDVTQEIMDESRRIEDYSFFASRCCPLALALTKALGKPISVGLDTFGELKDDKLWKPLGNLTPEMIRFRQHWDSPVRNHEDCQPKTFELKINQEEVK